VRFDEQMEDKLEQLDIDLARIRQRFEYADRPCESRFTRLTELLMVKAPSAAPMMTTISGRCQIHKRLPPAIRKPMTTERTMTTDLGSVIVDLDRRVVRVVGGLQVGSNWSN